MREIKFRAWDKKLKIMDYYGSLWDIVNKINPDWLKREQDIMQYTGLKDKNGKEIYEGDILQTFWNNKSKELLSKGEVCFDEKKLQWMIGKAPIYNIECEIIGNIYENSELIENI